MSTPKPSYPPCTDSDVLVFRALELQLVAHPDLLDRADCPYSPDIKAVLRRALSRSTSSGAVTERLEAVAELGHDDILAEITQLYQELRRDSVNSITSDPKEKAALSKTYADLLTRMVTLKERGLGVRDVAKFQSAVMSFLEQICTPAQRTDFVQILGKYIANV
jgi:hypothetical protein